MLSSRKVPEAVPWIVAVQMSSDNLADSGNTCQERVKFQQTTAFHTHTHMLHGKLTLHVHQAVIALLQVTKALPSPSLQHHLCTTPHPHSSLGMPFNPHLVIGACSM